MLERQQQARDIEMSIISEQARWAREGRAAQEQYAQDEMESVLADMEDEVIAQPSRDIVIVGRLHERLRDMNKSRDEETEDDLFYMAKKVFAEYGYELVQEGRGKFSTIPPLPELAL